MAVVILYLLEVRFEMKKMLVVLVLVMALALMGCNRNKNRIYVYNWSEYMPDEVIRMFQKETGIRVIYTTYDSNELMYSKIRLQGGEGYDLIFPSSYYVDKMAKEGLLAELDHARLSNIGNLNPYLMNQPYDKGNRFSMPYMWGTSLVAYNNKFTQGFEITSWGDMWRPEFAGRVLLNNDMREVFQMALMYLGYSGNTTEESEIREAYELLTKLVPNVRLFNSDSPKTPFINEEVYIGLMWSGEIYMAMEANPHVQFVFPKEGAIAWVDCMSIPRGAKNVDNAYKFMDFLLRPEIALMIVEEVGYSTPNKAALAIMPEEIRNNPLMNPSVEVMQRAEFQNDIGNAILIYDRFWERLKTGR
jgi:spermidine/putrescine transport system substrate-binding protein